MFWLLVEKELKSIILSPKFVATFGICSLLMLLSLFIGIQEHNHSVSTHQTARQLTDRELQGEERGAQRTVDVVADALTVRRAGGVRQVPPRIDGGDGLVQTEEAVIVVDEPAVRTPGVSGDGTEGHDEARQEAAAHPHVPAPGQRAAGAVSRRRMAVTTSPTGMAAMHVWMRQRLDR